jgi:hypothetical protein
MGELIAAGRRPQMDASDTHNTGERSDNLAEALSALEELDRRRNLSVAAAILLFFGSAGVAVVFFFIVSDLLLWDGMDELVARLLIAISWISIFPVWIVAFLAAMWLLDAMGVRDMRAVANHRLSELALGLDELHELRNAVANRDWKHGHIFEGVINDLNSETARAGGDTP